MKNGTFAIATKWLGTLCTTLVIMLLCICIGSVNIPLINTINVLWCRIINQPLADTLASSIILSVRIPRVLCVGLVGAALALCGGAMQGLLQNPLADGSTMGVTAGASLGAVIAIAFGVLIPGFPFSGVMGMSMVFAFLSLIFILALAYRLDHSFATQTIILIGVIFSMFAHSIISFVTVFSGEKMRNITFWTMGSFAQASYKNMLILLVALVLFGGVLLRYSNELNVFAIGEQQAGHIGVNVKRVKLLIMIAVSCLIGICVAVSGSIGFVGLIVPHMVRRITGPNHKRLLPASMVCGANFLMLSDLVSRVVLRPLELPIGVITSFIGSIVFVLLFFQTRKGD